MMKVNTLLEEALKLPLRAKKKVIKVLLDSIDDHEIAVSIREGAHIAEKRIDEMRRGKSKEISEEELEDFLARKTRR